MIHFVDSHNLTRIERLAHDMFTDRAKQFSDRLGWDVVVDDTGEERDEYDSLNPLYVIVSDCAGRHLGSMRFLPTTERTMVNEHFRHVTDGVEIASPFIWECTRFCISEHADLTTSALLMAAGAKLMTELGIEHLVGVFDRRMEFVYRRLGTAPTIIGKCGKGRSGTGVGLWEFSASAYQDLLKKSGVSEIDMEMFFANSDLGRTVHETECLIDKAVA